ncbi:hypothetical protein [Granulosicoccus antarcticus]|uniref:Uncharacterized protein n=1 Tax=Granulosicoccus antarcticus IMCC3135 TaxID=1192854 RepID=A0A2Z2NRP1_9GAMM|nr:hypothetical protein [Granulosicoccus antarcticus]ASJ73909.1 hypothetical protein IMCC3135_19150 [Granulosicoccus antarcticus IMCC3135]
MVHKSAADKCLVFDDSISISCYQEYDSETGDFYRDKLEDPRNRFSGLISHSTLGSTVLSTAEHLGLAVDASQYYSAIRIWPVYRQSPDGDLEYAPGGPVVLTGIKGEIAALETAYTGQERSPQVAHMKLSLFDHADPLFAKEGQASLSPWSPTVDTGVEPTTFQALLLLLRDYQEEWQEQVNVPYEPLDGLGDGKAVHDSGSHEYVLGE